MTTNVDQVLATLDSLHSGSFKDEKDRVDVLRRLQAATQRLETPWESIMRLTFQEASYDFAIVMACEVSLFKHLTSIGKTTDELAGLTSTQPEFLVRILRHLATRSTIAEKVPGLWASTPLSEALVGREAAAGVHWGVPYYTRVFHAGPPFFRQNGYSSPRNPRDTLFNHAYDCVGETKWQNQQKHPEDAHQFQLMLAYAERHHPSWLDMCNADELFKNIQEMQDPEAAAFVDVGGGHGIDVVEVRKRYPKAELPARIILQEQAKVVDAVKESGGEDGAEDSTALEEVELQEYDFFTEQPVTGARVYFLASIMHDWPEEDARKILGRVADAMKRGFSKLMVSDYVIPEEGCIPQVSGLDLLMMAVFGSGERTRETWDRMLESQGLVIRKIHTAPTAYKSLLEIELA